MTFSGLIIETATGRALNRVICLPDYSNIELQPGQHVEPDDGRPLWTPAEPPIRTISAAAFVMRFSPAEVRLLQADDMLNQACLKATAQGRVNLDSLELRAPDGTLGPLALRVKVVAQMSDARIAQVLRDGVPDEEPL